MANYENIRDKGFDKRTTNELRVIASKGERHPVRRGEKKQTSGKL